MCSPTSPSPAPAPASFPGSLAFAEVALRRTARRYSLCADDAEDAYQRAVEILLTNAPSADARQLAAWMQVVTRQEALALRRSRERLLGRRPDDAGDPLERVAGVVGAPPQQALARASQRQRLPPGHHLHPGSQVARIGRRCPGEQDLDRALVGVLGVVGAERVAASGAPQGRLRRGKLSQGIDAGAGAGLGEVGLHIPFNPVATAARPRRPAR